MTKEEKTTYISIALDSAETKLLDVCKEKSGIKGSADLIRHLIVQYAKDSNKTRGS